MATTHSTRSNGEYLTPSAPRPFPTVVVNIKILHPGYDDLIIQLPILDIVNNSDPPQFGFHHGTALMICFIITGNRPGFLSPTRLESDDPNAVANPPENTPAFDDILLESSYYYYINSARLDEKHQVISDLAGWSFPQRSSLPELHWQQWEAVFDENEVSGARGGEHMTRNVSVQVKSRDGRCLLTGVPAINGCQSTHIIPEAEKNWFINNRMETFAKSTPREKNPTTRPSNMFVLRADIHLMFDQHYFTFVPKHGQLVVHFVDTAPITACHAFHSASIGRPTELSAEYFLTNLALTVIPLTIAFNERYGKSLTKSTKKRTRDQSGGGSRGKKSKPAHDDMDDNSFENPTISIPNGSDASSDDSTVDEDGELADDLKTAASYLPHIFGSTLDKSNLDSALPNPNYGGLVDTLVWYPGHRRVERMKATYLKANPQIRATSSGSNGEWDSHSAPVHNM